MLNFVRGNAREPGGNLLVFCHVRGFNPVQPGGNIIVCNVVVSYASAGQKHFPVVVFPPSSLAGEQELEELFALNPHYDVVQIENFEIPSDSDENEYIKDRLDGFNRCVMEYVEVCRASIHGRVQRVRTEAGQPLLADEKSSLDALEQLLESQDRDGRRIELRRVLRHMEIHYPHYDVRNLERVVMSTGYEDPNDISRLYIKKFRAIEREAYEEAAHLHARIRSLDPLADR